jgi:glycosyltransferase involved in cell wall biosynthesis
MKKLRIAQIAPLWFPIPPQKYGGTERVVSYLTEGLVKRGHRVTLFASGDSKTRAKLISITKKHLIARGVPWQDWWWNNLNYSFAFERAKEFDLIHSHWTPVGMFFQGIVKTPVLHTLHNIPRKTDHRWPIFRYYKNSNVVFISKKQKVNSLVRFKNEWVVYNGLDISQFKFNLSPKNYFIWIGRICPDKGTDLAIKIAKKRGIKLLLAGQLQPMYQDFFKKEIKPHLGQKIKYIGELSQAQLSSFYGSAKALIYPHRWQEPFGLVMIESMACGTPVIAFNRGSVPEIVKDGKTGFVVNSIKEAVEAVKKIDQINRLDCRKWVEEKFTVEKMVDNYERVYYKILGRKYGQ